MPIANENPGSYQVLDPCLLGRPVHLLPQFATELGEDLASAMHSPAWRRSWGAFRLESVEFGAPPEDLRLRWLGLATAQGMVAVAFERRLLLGLLSSRYGQRGEVALPAHDLAAERVTATEERLASTLSRQLVDVLRLRIAGQTASSVAPGAATIVGAPGRAAWALRVEVSAVQSGERAQCWISPDQAMMAAIMQGLTPESSRRPRPARAEPLASALQLRLDGRLVSKEIPLAALFELKVGDVIPVSVGRAEVLLDEARLFTAAVAEHKEKLCLTSFEFAE
jgi:flagellar motor switch protein FliM